MAKQSKNNSSNTGSNADLDLAVQGKTKVRQGCLNEIGRCN